MSKGCRRLQGEDFKNKKDALTLVHYNMSNNYHIKGIYKDTYGYLYSHWLNDEEIKELILKVLDKINKKVSDGNE